MKRMNNKNPFAILFYSLVLMTVLFLAVSCNQTNKSETTNQLKTENASQIISSFFATNGNYIASEQFPGVLTAADVYQMLGKNILIIDLRNAEQYAAGFIEGAVNLKQEQLIDYFSTQINAASFEKIILVDSRGQLSSYATGILRLLGYDNVYSIRFGMSSWNKQIAQSGWDKAISNDLEGKLDKTAYPKNVANSQLPMLQTGGSTAFEIVLNRAEQLLDSSAPSFLVSYKEVISQPDKYYVISYIPEDLYLKTGHLSKAIQFTPKKSLLPEQELFCLPVDKPIAVYCFSGHQSANVAAYLRMLGYDAYSIIYGANSFINNTLVKDNSNIFFYWSDLHKNDFPLISGQKSKSNNSAATTEIKAAKGGC